MLVYRATTLGMCFGVRDALAAARQVPQPASVTILGELVHNGQVLQELDQLGYTRSSEELAHELPATDVAMITAHGASQARRQRLLAAGRQIIDTTCPLVTHLHTAAKAFREEGRFLVLIGHPGHVEVRGVIEDTPDSAVVESAAAVRCFEKARIGVVSQTTIRPEHAADILLEIRRLNPASDVQFRDTICSATKRRTQAVVELLPRVDGLIVVGGANSNNTRGLVALARDAGKPAWQVETAGDLQPGWFENMQCIGLTAGASTLDTTIDAVEAALVQIPSIIPC